LSRHRRSRTTARSKARKASARSAPLGIVQHIAFSLPHEAAGIELRERLKESGVGSTDVGSAGPIRNTLFFDNNGLLLEATWPKP
jgi:hypothetical protein